MSGFEVVGVVLAVIPLLISAVEDYEKDLHPLKMLLYPGKYRKELLRLGRTIRVQRDLFEGSLETLLSPAVSTGELHVLLKDPNGPAWHTLEMATKLKGQLETTHSGCLIVIEEMGKTFNELQELLCARKVKFSFQKEKRKELLNELQQHNNNLQTFAKRPKQSDNLTLTKDVGPNLQQLQRMRLKALELHEALSHNFNCKSGLPHTANLRLEKTDVDTKSELNFRMLFSLASLSYTGDLPVHWRSKEVELREVDSSATSLTEAEDVCSALTHLSHSSTKSQPDHSVAMECVTSPNGSVQFSLKAVSQPIMPEGEPQVSIRLSQILGRLKLPSPTTPSWYQWHRAKVALLLAHAVLQLHGSPWMSSSWGSKDVQLLAIPSERTLASSWQPFISKTFDPPSTELSPKLSKRSGPYVRSPELYALAIVLLELAFNTPLQQKRIDVDDQDADTVIYNTACRLTDDDLYSEMGPDYTDAVKRCIYGFEGGFVHDLNSEQFHKAVCAGVIEPLERNLKWRTPPGW